MSLDDAKTVIAESKNGVVTPLYFDRQVIRATDLTLDRDSHDAALARMRRLLHGWGIVSGFIPEGDGDKWTLSPGYGVSPTGAEVFLAGEVKLEGLRDLIIETCAAPPPGCELIDEKEIAEAGAEAAAERVGAWLIVRPDSDDTDKRPGVPQGCEHPANALLPTRRCHGVQLELICALPPGHLVAPGNCADLSRFICIDPAGGPRKLWPYPEPPGGEDDFLVIGRFTTDEEKEIAFTPTHRRTVLPVTLLQDWMQSCLCPLLTRTPEPEPEPEPEPDPDTDPTGPEVDWGDLFDVIEDIGLLDDPDSIPHDVTGGGRPPLLFEEEVIIDILKGTGVGGPEDFLDTDPVVLAEAMGVTEAEVLGYKEDLKLYEAVWNPGATPPRMAGDWTEFNDTLAAGGVDTAWKSATGTAPAVSGLTGAPRLTEVVADPVALTEKGLNGPADVVAMETGALASTLGVSRTEAAAIKVDLTRFNALPKMRGPV